MTYLGLIGLLIIAAASTRWFWRAWQVNVPAKPYLFQGLVGTGFVLGCLSIYLGQNDPYASWAVGVGIVILYLLSTGAQKAGAEMVNVGDTVPAFSAPDDNGEMFDSASLEGSRVLLKFFRGHW